MSSENQSVIFPELGHPPEKVIDSTGRKKTVKKGYAAPPGTGPEGETCKSCKFKTKKLGVAGHFLKCDLMRSAWTGGTGTDIKAKSPACREWESGNF